MDQENLNQYYNGNYGAYRVMEEHESLERYTAKTFGWMFLGLMVTFLVAVTGYVTRLVLFVALVPQAFLVLGIAEVAVVLFLSARITKMSVGTARALFMVYSVLNGVVFSTYFLIYSLPSLVYVFGATSLFFGIMAAIGYFAKADLSRLRNFLVGGLVFLLVFWVASMFLNLQRFEVIACSVGIFIFLLFSAYDTQKIRAYHQVYCHDGEMAAKASIFAALQLYLDFINLFLYLLRVLGRRK
ncbi:MAG: Bax inhibitor-1/YccA family protein [Hungatella sp.]|nr:Bax inhibitor-1/YccA family protein [Hungatella sp.]